ncbi:class I SAM-dependent methyltransferase [Variovorax sp. KK3]|uniref:class I SAM-dependent methyltransferase n=1 Tax=Variovorax sp. KK3 TaxID=1855728 RepID=UPI0009FA517B|nr:methyltransferase domain-containing protein [Variovorax sp. KK3]
MNLRSTYCCPESGCDHAPLEQDAAGLNCPNGHQFPFEPGTDVPVFASEPEGANEYAQANAAEVHDNALRWVFATFHADEQGLRERLVARIGLKKGQRILVTGAGAGNDLPYLVRALDGAGDIYAQDIAKEMLLAGVARYRTELAGSGVSLHFSASDASHLPFADGFFDAAYHFGGINLFPDIPQGIAEMNRVVKQGGNVVIGDEGLAPWLVDTELGRMLVTNNALYARSAPLSALPATARAAKLSWELSNCFYVIEFQASTEELSVDIDVPHVGTRGGTIRSRYFGRMEGVDPVLRDRVYQEAQKRGMSRVAFLESALRASLAKD